MQNVSWVISGKLGSKIDRTYYILKIFHILTGKSLLKYAKLPTRLHYPITYSKIFIKEMLNLYNSFAYLDFIYKLSPEFC